MLKRTRTPVAIPAVLVIVAMAATGCGLLETNDDELETLRVEIIQLREDFLEIEAEVSLMARRVATTTTTPSPATTAAPAAATTTMATAEDSGDDEVTTPTVPVGLDEDTILTATYQWGPSDPALILQELLGITADGWYGNGTRGAHLTELESRGLDTSGVPNPPTTTVATDAADDTAIDDAATDDAATDDAATDDAATDDAATEATTTTEAVAEATTTTAAD
jgi:hypothetical protein